MSVMDRPRVLFVLQNSWRKGAKPGEVESDHAPRVWQRLLWRSLTGKRLTEMIPDGIAYDVVNASAFVGNRSFVAFVADSMLMNARMYERRPALVVLCGKVAQELAHVIEQHGRPYVLAPHPAWRALSKVRTAEIREEIIIALN